MSQRKIENCIHILYIAVFVYIVLSLAVATARIDYPCKTWPTAPIGCLQRPIT